MSPDKRTGPPDWILIVAIGIVTAYHLRSVYRIWANPVTRRIFADKIRALAYGQQRIDLTHIEPIGSTWLKETGL